MEKRKYYLEVLKECSDIIKPETYQAVNTVLENVKNDNYKGCVDDDTKRVLNILTHNSVGYKDDKLTFYSYEIGDKSYKKNRENYLQVIRSYIKYLESKNGNQELIDMLYNAELWGSEIIILRTRIKKDLVRELITYYFGKDLLNARLCVEASVKKNELENNFEELLGIDILKDVCEDKITLGSYIERREWAISSDDYIDLNIYIEDYDAED